MTALRISPEAADDLDEMWSSVARTSETAADDLVEQFWRVVDRLLEYPALGHRHTDLPDDCRVVNMRGRWIVIHRYAGRDDVLEVVRIAQVCGTFANSNCRHAPRATVPA